MDRMVYSQFKKEIINSLEEEEILKVNLFREIQNGISTSLTECRKEKEELKKVETRVHESIFKIKQNIQGLSKILEQIMNVREKGEQALEASESEKKELEKKLEKLKKEKEQLIKKSDNFRQNKFENIRRVLKAYRILTSTYFDFGSIVCGYTLSPDLQYKCFEMDPNKMNQQEITEHLWRNLSESTVNLNVLRKNVKENS